MTLMLASVTGPQSAASVSTWIARGSSTFASTTDVALSGVTAIERICGNGVGETSWIESTAPSDDTQSRGSSRSRGAFRAYSIDEMGATSISPSRSMRLSVVGTPVTSWTSCVSRWKTGAMLT